MGKEVQGGFPKKGGDRSGSGRVRKIWREGGEERHSRLGQRRPGWEYMMHAQGTINRPTFLKYKVYIGKY